jgi:hypothetical protein
MLTVWSLKQQIIKISFSKLYKIRVRIDLYLVSVRIYFCFIFLGLYTADSDLSWNYNQLKTQNHV